ncbi:hypothetical protein SEA_BIGSWOLE_77 [Mycobacterium phage Bigswole]|uniref:Uncharacterized protein n=2 Tax=Bixzunavirus TaxID=680114 RepID=A0A2D1G776_9CAUD|nr:hypothetical protein KHO58_gp077 [Mycobacterium phage Bigswole]ATN87751.1 hypothetical protein SEA_BIGSWOLE_77 [Mycobacterium phage Bigswole]
MKTVRVTTQRIKRDVSFGARYVEETGAEGLKNRMYDKAIEDDDSRWSGEQDWHVDSVEVVSQYVNPRHPGVIRVNALITESKTIRVPETTEEDPNYKG